jgi:hypothetical protein
MGPRTYQNLAQLLVFLLEDCKKKILPFYCSNSKNKIGDV